MVVVVLDFFVFLGLSQLFVVFVFSVPTVFAGSVVCILPEFPDCEPFTVPVPFPRSFVEPGLVVVPPVGAVVVGAVVAGAVLG